MRHLAILGVMAVASLLAPGLARAESAQDLAWCKGDGSPTLEQQIGGCTALIDAKSGEARTRALNYFRRAGAYLRQQDYDRTISDFGEGLALDAGNAAGYFGRAIAYEAKKDADRALRTTTRRSGSTRATSRRSATAPPSMPTCALTSARSRTTIASSL